MSNSMDSINIIVLKSLVENTGDEFDIITGITGSEQSMLTNALREVLEDEKKVKIQKAATEILKVLKAADEAINSSVAIVRESRLRERKELERMQRINLAKEYGTETMNMLPLVSAIKGDFLNLVPVSWKSTKSSIVKKAIGKNVNTRK